VATSQAWNIVRGKFINLKLMLIQDKANICLVNQVYCANSAIICLAIHSSQLRKLLSTNPVYCANSAIICLANQSNPSCKPLKECALHGIMVQLRPQHNLCNDSRSVRTSTLKAEGRSWKQIKYINTRTLATTKAWSVQTSIVSCPESN
jgi:hypothetical protein